MNQACGSWTTLLQRCSLAALLSVAAGAPGADSLTWRKDKDSVDADISGWSVVRTLEGVAEATGWRIYLEPGSRRKVSTKFKERPRDKALDLLLGNLGRVLLPGTNGGPPRLLVFRNTEKDATRLIRSRKGPKPIPNELIVTMKPGKSIDDVASQLHAKILGRNKDRNAARLQFENEDATDSAREGLLNNEDVASVDPNFPVLSQPTPEGSAGSAAPDLHLQARKDGSPVILALIDTAVQGLGGDGDKFMLKSISVAGDAGTDADRLTHGTGMAETALNTVSRIAECSGGSRVQILPIDVYGPNTTTTTYDVAEGITQALKKGAGVINLSLGSEGDTPYLHSIIQQGAAAGTVFVASAGNTPVTAPVFPAAYQEVLAVTAGDAPGKLAPYANRGNFVDMMAPGTSLVNFNGQTWRVSGTSPAAAFVSGAIAAQADCGGLSLQQAAGMVQKSLPLPPLDP